MAEEYPFRLRVMRKLTELLETIAIEDSNSGPTGYHHDLAGRVFRGRNIYGENDPLPMIAILETPIANDQVDSAASSPYSTGDWDISIQGFCKDDKANPTDPAYLLVADVCRCLAKEKKRLDQGRSPAGVGPALLSVRGANGKPGVISMQIGSPVCRPPDEVSGKAYFWLAIRLKIAEDLENPYS